MNTSSPKSKHSHSGSSISGQNPKIIKPKNNASDKIKASPSCKTEVFNNKFEESSNFYTYQKKVNNEEIFDQFVSKLSTMQFYEAFEPFLQKMFNGDACFVWIDDKKRNQLYSPTLKQYSSYSNSIPGSVFTSQSMMVIKDTSDVPTGLALDPKISPINCPVLFFFLNPSIVVQVVRRSSGGGFQASDKETANMLQEKFAIYGNALFPSSSLSELALSLFANFSKSIDPLAAVAKFFQADRCSLWKIDPTSNSCLIYDPQKSEMKTCSLNLILQRVITQKCPINENIEEYGNSLVLFHEKSRRELWVVMLSSQQKSFNSHEELQLGSILPFLYKYVNGFGGDSNPTQVANKLGELLEDFSSISCIFDFVELEKHVVASMTKSLDCEHVQLRIFGKKCKAPTTGYSKEVVEARITSRHDSMSDIFSNEFDTIPGHQPKSYLGTPINDSNGMTSGYLIALSKHDSIGFDDLDQQIIENYSYFIGIAVENCRHAKNIRILVNDLCNNAPITKILHRIFIILRAQRVCLYSACPAWLLIANEGGTSHSDKEIQCLENQNETCGDINFTYLLSGKKIVIGAIGFSKDVKETEIYSQLIQSILDKHLTSHINLQHLLSENLDDRIFNFDYVIEEDNYSQLYRIVFACFNRFTLLDSFSITPLCLLTFCESIKLTINNVRIIHFLSTQIVITELYKQLQKIDLLVLLVSSLLCDYSIGSHLLPTCAEALSRVRDCTIVTSKDNANIFRSVTYKPLYDNIISNVLSVDPAQYESITSISSSDHVLKVAQLLILCSKLSIVLTLKKETKMKVVKMVDSFWKRANLKTFGISEARSSIDSSKNLPIFLEHVCLPAFQNAANLFPSLKILPIKIQSLIKLIPQL